MPNTIFSERLLVLTLQSASKHMEESCQDSRAQAQNDKKSKLKLCKATLTVDGESQPTQNLIPTSKAWTVTFIKMNDYNNRLKQSEI